VFLAVADRNDLAGCLMVKEESPARVVCFATRDPAVIAVVRVPSGAQPARVLGSHRGKRPLLRLVAKLRGGAAALRM